MSKELNILWMYPDILNLHGDRGNLMAFERIGKLMDVDINIRKIEHYNDEIDFENSDIMFFNVGEIKVMPSIINALKPHKEKIEKFINDNKTIILIGASGCIMAKRTLRRDGEFEGLGFLNMDMAERENIYGDDILFNLRENNMEIVGCQIKMLDTILHSDISLGELGYGSGNEGFEKKAEGAKCKNVIYTNALGPLFVKNPWYGEYIIKNALKNRTGEEIKPLGEEAFEVELKSKAAIKKFIDQKRG